MFTSHKMWRQLSKDEQSHLNRCIALVGINTQHRRDNFIAIVLDIISLLEIMTVADSEAE